MIQLKNSKLENEIGNINFSYLFSTKDRSNLEMYFKLKDKYEYSLSDEEINDLKNKTLTEFGYYDVVIVPETKGKHLHNIAKHIGKNVVIVKKRDKADIIEDLLSQKMMKNEKTSLLSSLEEMDVVQINKIKGNQRKRFRNILFEEINLPNIENKKVLLLDDSVFSGETLIALKESLNINCDVRVLFSKF